jgi:NADH:ubiquinone oxidoreductase subunit 2 (subunit N)
VRSELTGFAILGVLLSVVALGYYLRVIIAMYMQAPEHDANVPEPRPASAAATLASITCAALVLATGILPGWLLELT